MKISFSSILAIAASYVAAEEHDRNVFGEQLTVCSTDPMTGWYRTGYCESANSDGGLHTVCAAVTENHLETQKEMGNDLMTPRGSFPGLKVGDRWCLCALRWKQAYDGGYAPYVDLKATNKGTLNKVDMSLLEEYKAPDGF